MLDKRTNQMWVFLYFFPLSLALQLFPTFSLSSMRWKHRKYVHVYLFKRISLWYTWKAMQATKYTSPLSVYQSAIDTLALSRPKYQTGTELEERKVVSFTFFSRKEHTDGKWQHQQTKWQDIKTGRCRAVIAMNRTSYFASHRSPLWRRDRG